MLAPETTLERSPRSSSDFPAMETVSAARYGLFSSTPSFVAMENAYVRRSPPAVSPLRMIRVIRPWERLAASRQWGQLHIVRLRQGPAPGPHGAVRATSDSELAGPAGVGRAVIVAAGASTR